MSAYVGISEGAFNEALRIGKTYQRNQDHLKYILGKAYNAYLMGLVQWQSMINRVNDLNFNPGNQKTVDILSLKTNVTHACP